jgi:hypothetical protein
MTGDDYRLKVAELRARAANEEDPARRADFESLAQAYLRLAAQAKRNTETDITYEPPPPKIDTPAPR